MGDYKIIKSHGPLPKPLPNVEFTNIVCASSMRWYELPMRHLHLCLLQLTNASAGMQSHALHMRRHTK